MKPSAGHTGGIDALTKSALPLRRGHVSVGDIEILRLHYSVVTSTMAVARKQAREHVSPWLCVTADEQTRGRGTHGRWWFSPPGKGLYCSLLLPPPRCTAHPGDMTIRLAERTGRLLEELAGISVAVKHPNDLYSGGRKIAGIMIESQSSGTRLHSLVLGIGINCTQTEEDFDGVKLPEAGSILTVGGAGCRPEELVRHFLRMLVPWYIERYGGGNG